MFNSFRMKPAAPAPNLAALEAKLAALQASDPLARVPNLKADRTAALLCGDYDAVNGFDADIRNAELDSERRELEIEQCHRSIERAQADEHAAEVDRRVAAAKEKADEMPEALAAYEKACDQVRAALAKIDDINFEIAAANELLPEDSKLPNPEQHFRGALPADKRGEVGRRRLGSRWFYSDSGAPVDPARLEFVEGDRKVVGDIETTDGVRGRIKILDRDVGAWRTVEVVKRDIIEVTYDEARGGFTPVPLAAEVQLPAVMPEGGVDPRRPRERIKLII